MSDRTSIEWTSTVNADGSVTPGATWNPVRGCTKVSPGCANCYAETFAERFRGVPGHPYEQGFDLRLVPEKLMEPLKWKKPRRIFVNSMSDLFQDGVPDQFITDVFGIMALAHWHTFQVLTKRPQRMLDYLRAGDHGILRQFMLLQQNGGTSTREVFRALDIKRRDDIEWRWPLPNIWLGVSVENQAMYDKRIGDVLRTPAAVRFLSIEPMLGPIDMRMGGASMPDYSAHDPLPQIDWVIVGGESGHGARPFEPRWARSIVRQCRAARVPVFVKQLGAHVLDRNDAGFEGDTDTSWPMDTPYREDLSGFRDGYQGAPVRILLKKKGGHPFEWPVDLRVREFPFDDGSQRADRS